MTKCVITAAIRNKFDVVSAITAKWADYDWPGNYELIGPTIKKICNKVYLIIRLILQIAARFITKYVSYRKRRNSGGFGEQHSFYMVTVNTKLNESHNDSLQQYQRGVQEK